MPPPAKFSSVNYYLIDGDYSFAGELVIIDEALYFFPEIDLVAARLAGDDQPDSSLGDAKSIFRLIRNFFYGSYLERKGLWRRGISGDQFRELADAFITEENLGAPTATFSSSLPAPTCIRADEIANLEVSTLGGLSLSARSDKHDFLVGWWSRKKLRQALSGNGFAIV